MQIRRFKGLNNVSDPLRLGMAWLQTADNVNITDTGSIEKRDGYQLVASGNYSSAYSTFDFQRTYFVRGYNLFDFDGNVVASLTSTNPMYWAEINDQVFFNNGTDRGIIMPDNTLLPWAWPVPAAPNVAAVTGNLAAGIWQVRCTFVLADGRETGTSEPAEIALVEGQGISISDIPHLTGAMTKVYIAPANSAVYQLAFQTTGSSMVWNYSNDALGEDLRNMFLDSIPVGADVIQFWKGRAYAAQYDAQHDQTVVWSSEALGFHLFSLNRGFFLVPGHVLMLAPTEDALIVGTENRVYAYAGDKLDQVAEYGVVPGQHWASDVDAEGNSKIIFWTKRGVCSALPFTNLTEAQVSVAPGVRAGGAIVRQGGQVRYVVSLQQGGAAFNKHP